MKAILNFLLTLLVFWVGNQYFNEYIQIQDTKTLILASILMFVMSWAFGWLMVVSFGLIVVGIGCITTIILFFVGLFITPVKLLILNAYLPGFEIHGFWTYVILTAVFYIFSLKTTPQPQSNQQSN